jgi:hypothetical protein
MAEHHIALEFPFNRPNSFAIIGELTLHCAHIQNNKEVVVTVNPNITNFDQELVESAWGSSNRLLIFNVDKKERLAVTVDGKDYEIELMTWAKIADGVLQFDFVVEEK